MISKSILAVVVACLLAGAAPLPAQTGGSAYEAELSVPFGTAQGKLLLLGDYLVFVDDLQLPDSFVISRDLIERVTGGSQMVTIETKRPVHDRSGERVRFSFRLTQGADPALVTRWFQGRGATGVGALAQVPVAVRAPAPVPTGEKPTTADELVYKVRHDHRLGGCQGRLVVGQDRIVYESIDNIGHSRNWLLKDIKELKLDNPYTLNIEPFSGGKYTIQFEGQGMEPEVYRSLVDRVTSARNVRN